MKFDAFYFIGRFTIKTSCLVLFVNFKLLLGAIGNFQSLL